MDTIVPGQESFYGKLRASLPLKAVFSFSTRLLKAMGWQEYPENDENCLPLTEDELREFHMKTEQLRRNGFGKNGFLQSRSSNLFSPTRSTCRAEFEDLAMETSSSETSDDNA